MQIFILFYQDDEAVVQLKMNRTIRKSKQNKKTEAMHNEYCNALQNSQLILDKNVRMFLLTDTIDHKK